MAEMLAARPTTKHPDNDAPIHAHVTSDPWGKGACGVELRNYAVGDEPFSEIQDNQACGDCKRLTK